MVGNSGAWNPRRCTKEIVTSGPRKLADVMQALLAFLAGGADIVLKL